MRRLRLVLVGTLALLACLTAAEIARRVLDGYYVWRPGLEKNPWSTDLTWSSDRPVEALLKSIDLDIEADRSWFYDRPRSPTPAPDPSEWAEQRRAAFDPQANYVWNATRIGDIQLREYLRQYKGRLDEIFTFRPPGNSPFPHYRLYPNIRSGFGLTNEFGWRGGVIEVEKPSNVIRIGVLGDSTTNEYPAMLEHWLNLWSERRHTGVRFEVMNAARPATGALDAAAILEFELAPAGPDYVITYGFGNGIHVADALVALPSGMRRGQPAAWQSPDPDTFGDLSKRLSEKLEPAARWSAAAAFLRDRVAGRHGDTLLPEPSKPPTTLVFPPDLDEMSPDPDRVAKDTSQGLMLLETYLQGLDKMNAIAQARDIRLLVSTFRVLAFDGMRAGGNLYRTINQDYWWPYTYAQIRRLTAFYNRTLRAWAERRGQGILEIDERMPWRPELYGDGLHELPAGEALHAWVVFQQLLPRIRADLAAGNVPKPGDRSDWANAPYWKIERVSVAKILGE
jgi:hypothetical protein